MRSRRSLTVGCGFAALAAGTALVAALGTADPGQAQTTTTTAPRATSPVVVERAQSSQAVAAEWPE
jgi:hypothetical protein